MTDGLPDPQDGIDPALWAELSAVMDEVQRLVDQRRAADDNMDSARPGMCRVTLQLPEEMVLQLAWMAVRHERRRQGQDGATGLSIEAMRDRSPAALVRNYVRPFLYRTLYELANDSAEDLRHGAHPLLRPEPNSGSAWTGPKGDLDDGIPF